MYQMFLKIKQFIPECFYRKSIGKRLSMHYGTTTEIKFLSES